MPRAKKPLRNPLGSITPVTTTLNGKTVNRFDASKRYTKADGTPGKKFKRCRDYEEAQIALHNFGVEIERELAADDTQGRRFFELCEYFDKHYITEATFAGDEKESGYRQNLAGLRTYLDNYKAFFGDVPVSSITYESLRRYRQHLRETPRVLKDGTAKYPSPATVNRKLAVLRRVLNVAVKRLKWLAVNPFNDDDESLIKIKQEKQRDRVLSFEEEQRLLAACVGRRKHLKLALIAAIDTGMRKRELFTLRVEQIDFPARVIRLNALQTKALQKRDIPLSSRLCEAIEEQIAAKDLGPLDLILEGAKDFDTSFRNACKAAGIEDFRWHDLRHTSATLMDAAGISEAARMNAIGHSTKKIASVYANSSPDIIEESRVKMDEFRQKLEERRRNVA